MILNCQGAYIKLSGGNVEIGAPNDILLKSHSVQMMPKNSLWVPMLILPSNFEENNQLFKRQFVLCCEDGYPLKNVKYKVTVEGTDEIFSGLTNENGESEIFFTEVEKNIIFEYDIGM